MKERISLLRNVAMIAGASYIELAVGLFAGVLIARTLGPSDYGHYAFAIWLCGALIMAGNNALPLSAIRFLAEARGAGDQVTTEALVSRFMRMQAISSVLVLGVFSLAMWMHPISDWRNNLPLMLGLAVVATWARAGFWMRGAVSKGYELFVPENLALAVTALFNLVLVATLSWKGASIEAFFAAYAATGVLSNLIVRFMLRRFGVRAVPATIDNVLAQRLRRHLILTGLMVVLVIGTNRGVEMTLLKMYASPQEVGYFAIAATLTKGAVDLLSGGMATVLLPAMSRRYGEGGAGSLAPFLAESARLYWFVGMAIAGLGVTVSPGLVHLLYGQRYDGAVPALMGFLVVAGVSAVNAAGAAVLTASDHQLDRIRIIACVLAFSIACGLLLVPAYGLSGAVASFALTQMVDTALVWWFAHRRTQVRLHFGPMFRLSIAAAIATAIGSLAGIAINAALAFIVGGGIFFAVYLSLSVLLRTWRASDFEVAAILTARIRFVGPWLSSRMLALRRCAIDSAA